MPIALALAAAIACVAPHIADGDTLTCSGVRVRLQGIDAPELMNTRCRRGRRIWACEPEQRRWAGAAADRLEELTRGPVTCQDSGQRSFRRVVGRCYVQGQDVGAVLVREGLARSEAEFGNLYAAEQDQAQRAHRGGVGGSSRGQTVR